MAAASLPYVCFPVFSIPSLRPHNLILQGMAYASYSRGFHSIANCTNAHSISQAYFKCATSSSKLASGFPPCRFALAQHDSWNLRLHLTWWCHWRVASTRSSSLLSHCSCHAFCRRPFNEPCTLLETMCSCHRGVVEC